MNRTPALRLERRVHKEHKVAEARENVALSVDIGTWLRFRQPFFVDAREGLENDRASKAVSNDDETRSLVSRPIELSPKRIEIREELRNVSRRDPRRRFLAAAKREVFEWPDVARIAAPSDVDPDQWMSPGKLPEVVPRDPMHELGKGYEGLVAHPRVVAPAMDEHQHPYARSTVPAGLPSQFGSQSRDLTAVPEAALVVEFDDGDGVARILLDRGRLHRGASPRIAERRSNVDRHGRWAQLAVRRACCREEQRDSEHEGSHVHVHRRSPQREWRGSSSHTMTSEQALHHRAALLARGSRDDDGKPMCHDHVSFNLRPGGRGRWRTRRFGLRRHLIPVQWWRRNGASFSPMTATNGKSQASA